MLDSRISYLQLARQAERGALLAFMYGLLEAGIYAAWAEQRAPSTLVQQEEEQSLLKEALAQLDNMRQGREAESSKFEARGPLETRGTGQEMAPLPPKRSHGAGYSFLPHPTLEEQARAPLQSEDSPLATMSAQALQACPPAANPLLLPMAAQRYVHQALGTGTQYSARSIEVPSLDSQVPESCGERRRYKTTCPSDPVPKPARPQDHIPEAVCSQDPAPNTTP